MIRLSRQVVMWFGSFVIVATFFRIYWGVPLTPLLLGGGLTLLVTVARFWFAQKGTRMKSSGGGNTT